MVDCIQSVADVWSIVTASVYRCAQSKGTAVQSLTAHRQQLQRYDNVVERWTKIRWIGKFGKFDKFDK